MTHTLNIRPYGSEDALQIQEIYRLTWAPTNSPGPEPAEFLDEYRQRLQTHTILVGNLNSQVCGYIGIAPLTPLVRHYHVVMLDIAVHPEFQRQGIAMALLQAAEDWGRKHSKRKLSLRVLETNPGAVQLYQRFEFVEEGWPRKEFQLDGKFVDDILMSKWLGDDT